MRNILFIILSIISSSAIFAQTDTCMVNSPVQENTDLFFMENTSEFNNYFTTALEKFPELQNSKIEIKRKRIFTMMAARPERGFIFRPKDKRKYIILITNHPDMNADSIYSNVGNEAIIGLFGHELSHLLEYQEKNNFKMMCFVIGYVFHRRKVEVQTDMIAIERGFGPNIASYNRFIFHSHFVNKNYLHKKEKYYLSEMEIEENTNHTDLNTIVQ